MSHDMTKAVSSWSVHRTLGSFHSGDEIRADRVQSPRDVDPTGGLPLLDLPDELRRRGFDTVQICHFHLPTRHPDYLASLRARLENAGVTLDALLVDDGDLTHPTDADVHQAWISGWLDDAEALGARRARLVAGKQTPTPERLESSGRRLAELAAAHPGVRVVTENWMALMPSAAEVHAVLGAADGSVGFLIDLGNWKAPEKYDELASVAPLAETCHAKCHFTAEGPDSKDFQRSLGVLRDHGTGDIPLALIYDGPDDDEWSALDLEHSLTAH